MIEAPLPADEYDRQASLDKLQLLNTPLDKRYDRITNILAELLNVPMTCFTLLDRQRLWFKSLHGANITELDRKISFCSHTVLGRGPMIINNALHDDRFIDNPLVTGDPHIVFYAGYPIHTPDGHSIGALCAMDRTPREVSPAQIQGLKDLAEIVESEIRYEHLGRSSQALSFSRLSDEQRRLMIDPVTRVWNLPGFLELFTNQWNDHARLRLPIGLVRIKMDFNPASDLSAEAIAEILHVCAKRLVNGLRQEDVIGYVDTHEFMIMVPGLKPKVLREFLERIRLIISLGVQSMDKTPEGLSFSFGGICDLPDLSLNPEKFMEMAYRQAAHGALTLSP